MIEQDINYIFKYINFNKYSIIRHLRNFTDFEMKYFLHFVIGWGTDVRNHDRNHDSVLQLICSYIGIQ